jgi:hypothetical protein
MTVDEVRERVEEIRAIASEKGGDAQAHEKEDELHIAVLRAIADGMINDARDYAHEAKDLASEALETMHLDFRHWYE